MLATKANGSTSFDTAVGPSDTKAWLTEQLCAHNRYGDAVHTTPTSSTILN